ncbi:DnaJ-domain-containing protein [Annulohypoxylon maeteangense]|uniref:DnaJ-domain-containing protein n=1 Tax=Annulohypoxylon maeteangense TaxID=1927788 RepID=UPI0020089CB5|nr:DnaJ-domain-containing protein [Annulohypoxylon maeteangense]KAI0885446.1 DnaJ-domain-containing protein [Annulohypoxylon maeteangense]
MLPTTANRKRKDRFDFYQQYIDRDISRESSIMVRPRFPKHDLYKALEVESDASLEDIKKAYRELCKKVHPDKAEGGNTPENNERFTQVQEAWEILRDDVLRREYDQYRANSAKDSSRRDEKDGDSGRRHRERKERKERSERSGKKEHNPRGSAKPKADRTHSKKGDKYEPKPNRNRKPYCEDWSESDHRDGSKSYQSGPEPGSWHYGTPPFYGPGGPPPPPPPQYGPYDQYTRGSRGPNPVKLEDRILGMRIRVDLNQADRDLDNLQADFTGFITSFKARFNFPDAEKRRWSAMFEDVNSAVQFLEDMYDILDSRLEAVETGRGKVIMTLDLPELMGILQAHITRMKYSLMAALIILDQLLGYIPYEAELYLLHTLEGRLYVLAWPAWIPADYSKPAKY